MSDGQLAALLAFLATAGSGLVAFARWAVRTVTSAMTASTEARIKQGEAFAVLRADVTSMRGEISEVHEWALKTPPQGHRRAKTEPKGNPTT